MYSCGCKSTQSCTELAWFCHSVGTWNDGINKDRIAKKYILTQKNDYGNSNISPCKNVIFKKIV
jgi:hypothetical protein